MQPGRQAVRIYTLAGCGYCTRAKELLLARGIPFDEVDGTTDKALQGWLKTTTGSSTFPQIFIRGTSVGGCSDLQELDASGQLQAMLQSGRPTRF
jgi:glutaredoxin 3